MVIPSAIDGDSVLSYEIRLIASPSGVVIPVAVQRETVHRRAGNSTGACIF